MVKSKFNLIAKFGNKMWYAVFGLVLSMIAAAGAADAFVPNEISVFRDDAWPVYHFITLDRTEEPVFSEAGDVQTTKADAKLFGVLPIKQVDVNTFAHKKLYPGGMLFGVKFYTKGVLVVGLSDVESQGTAVNPAYQSGVRLRDIVVSINGKAINTVEEMAALVTGCNGSSLQFGVSRNGQPMTFDITPVKSDADGEYKTGLWVRDSTAGIGTVTFIDPETNSFAGLGHGICDVDTGELMPLLKGTVVGVRINGINRGLSGKPGELKGYFNQDRLGSLTGNTDAGVYGIFSGMPDGAFSEPVSIGLQSEVQEGAAQIYCTLSDGLPKAYDIEIVKRNKNSSDTKNFVIRVTDETLLSETGGIVQGMSGSPILQNGKLIGAVTHVLINDPTRGYGIYIENMLKNMSQLYEE